MNPLLTSDTHVALTQGAVVLTPNDRLARSCTLEFDQQCQAQGQRAWETPLIQPVSTWMLSLYRDLQALALVERRLLSDEQSRVLWKTVVDEAFGAELLSVGSTARAAALAWELEHLYGDGTDPSSFPLSEDQRQYEQWKARFVEHCQAGSWIDPVVLERYLVDHLEAWPKTLAQRFLLIGFTEKTPSLQRLVEHMRSLGVDVNEVPSVTQETLRCSIQPAHDDEQELLACAHWAREQVRSAATDGVTAPGAIGVVIPDLHARRDEVLRTFDRVFFPAASPAEIQRQGRAYDLSLGLPLSRYAVVDHALLLLQVAYDRVQGGDLSRLLLSPFMLDATAEHDVRGSFDALLREQQIRAAGLGLLRTHQSTPALLRAACHRVGDHLELSRTHPSEWLSRFVTVLENFGWPGDVSLDTIEHQTVEAWRRALETLHALDAVTGPVTWQTMLQLLREHIDRRVFQPQSTAVPVLILGVLESQGLHFQQLRVLGMDNESWPATLSPSPFLPMKWQKNAGVPGASPVDDLQRAKKQLGDWLARSDAVIFSHALHRHGGEIECTPMLRELLSVDVNASSADLTAQHSAEADRPVLVAMDTVAAQVTLTQLDDAFGPGVPAGTRVKGGARLLEDQAHCPFRAYAIHRLGIRELEEPGIGIDARAKGTIFHATVQYFWEAVRSLERLQTLDEESLDRQLETAVKRAFSETDIASAELRSIEQQRVFRIAKNWLLTHESRREEFTVAALEATDEYDFGPLKLKLAVDRVDELADGRKVIIDYKTGRRNSTVSWKEERITSPQLPLYTVLQKTPVAAVCFAQVAVNQQRFIGMGAEKTVLPGVVPPANEAESWEQQLQDWTDRLGLLADEIHRGVASVTPGKSACVYCPLPALCRVDDATLEAAEEQVTQGLET